MKTMRKPPLKERKFRRTKGKLYFQTKDSVTKTVDPQISPRKQLLKIMGHFLTKPAEWKLFNKKEIKDDLAAKSNWICNDQQCPNPYTHARGDPCKLTMEDLFPSRPEPPTSEVTKQPEDESEDWLIEWDRENRDKNN